MFVSKIDVFRYYNNNLAAFFYVFASYYHVLKIGSINELLFYLSHENHEYLP